jgi:hypothetical protein
MPDRFARGASLIAIFTAIAAFTISISIDTTDDGHGHRNVTFKVNQARDDGRPTLQVGVPAAVVAVAAPTLEDSLKDETPPEAEQVVPGQLTAAQEAAARIRATQPPLPTAGASAGFQGCVTRFVGNQSSRRGVRPQLQVLHYTVSPNVIGWADVNAVVGLFSRFSSQASSNFVIDGEGHCAYIVPIEAKAWTQAAGNPFSVSYEIINSGRESEYLATAGYARLRDVMNQVALRTGIPMRRGAVVGCVPTRTGIVQHKDFGICGGGHVDISPFNADQVIKILSTVPCGTSCQKAHRTSDLRKRNRGVHHDIHTHSCNEDHPRAPICVTFVNRHRAIHAASRREHIRL